MRKIIMMKGQKQRISLLLVLIMVLNLFVYSVPAAEDEVNASGTSENVETTAPVNETADKVAEDAKTAQKPEVPASEKATEPGTPPASEVPETKTPEVKAAGTETPQTGVPKTEAPEEKTPAAEVSATEKQGAESEEDIAALSAPPLESLFTINASGMITAFAYNSSDPVSNLEIPNSVNSITVTGIGDSVFSGCQLETVVIPATVTSIGNSAFQNNVGLTSVTFAAGSQLKIVGSNAFQKCSTLLSITLPNSVTSIGGSAFYECEALTSFAIPTGTTVLQNETFYKCTSLANVTFHNSVTTLGFNTFAFCTSLQGVELPDSLTTIGESAFSDSGLLEITIPKNVTSIGAYAFNNIGGSHETSDVFIIQLPYHYPDAIAGKPWGASTQNIYWKSNVASCFDITPAGVIVGLKPAGHDGGTCTNPAWHGVGGEGKGNITFPKQIGGIAVKALLPEAFSQNQNIRSIDFEPGIAITEIPDDAFYDCPNLETITLPEGIVHIGDWAFAANCCTSITLPESLKTIGESAFIDSSIETLTIPAAVNSIGKKAFANASSLESVTIKGSGALTIGSQAFGDNDTLEEILIPGRSYNTLINGSDNTDGDNQSGQPWGAQYAQVVWADGTYDPEIIYTDDWIFNRATGRLVMYTGSTGADVDLVVPYTISYNGADYTVKSMESALLSGEEFNKVTIAEGYTTELGTMFLSGAVVNEVILPSTLKRLPSRFVRYAEGLKHMNLPAGLTVIDNNVFDGCEELTKLDGFLPAGVTTIGNYAFCLVPLNISNWQIPTSVTTIGANAFAGTGLTGTIKIPSTVTNMQTTTFAQNPGITQIQLDMYRSDAPAEVKGRQPWGATDARVWYKGELPQSTHNEVANADLANSPLTQVDITSALELDNQGNPVTSIRGLWIAKGSLTTFPTSAVQIYDNPSDSSVYTVTKSLALPSGTYTVFASSAMMTQNQGQTPDPTQYVPYTFTVNKTLSMSVDANDFNVRTNDLPLAAVDVYAKAEAEALEPCYNDEATLDILTTDLAKINALTDEGESTKVTVSAAYTGEYDYTSGALVHPFGEKYAYTVEAEKEITVTLSDKYLILYKPGDHGQFYDNDTPVSGNISYGCILGIARPTEPRVTPEEGYVLTGWQAEHSDTFYEVGSVFDPLVTGNMTYVAQYKLKEYPVTYDANVTDKNESAVEPGSIPDPVTVVHGNKVTSPTAEPVRLGFEFKGWYKETLCKNPWNFAQDTVKAAVTLYAKWEPMKRTVTFDANDNDGNKSKVIPNSMPGKQERIIYDSITVPTKDPIREGFTFNGWYDGPGADAKKFDFDGFRIRFADVVIYAHWTPIPAPEPVVTYTVTFHKNGGDTQAKPGTKQVIAPADTIDALPTAPTRKGYTFESWNTQKNGKGTTFTAATKVTKDITVYAQWKKTTEVLDEEDTNYDFIKMADTVTVKAGQTVSYTMNGFGNKHDKALTNYEITDHPNEGINFVSAQLPAFTKGAGVSYDVIYTTKKTGLHTLHSNVPADQTLFVKAPKIAADDFITAIVFSFSSVPAGFGLSDSITLTFKIANQPPSTKLYNDAALSYDLDGKTYSYGGGGQKSTVTLGNSVNGKTYSYGSGSSTKTSSKTSPKTGDNSNAWFLTTLMLTAVVIMTGALSYRRKKTK